MKKYKPFLILIFIALFSTPAFSADKISAQRQKFITFALKYQGVKYVYGGTTPKGFDCSGYVDYVANHGLGIQLPRQAQAIYNKVKKISPKEREPGDLMFFKNDMKSDRITHVGIYCGVYHGSNKKFEGKRVFISAVSDGPRTGVILAGIDERFWKNHFFAYGRFLPSTKDWNKKHSK
ncbi:MAG: C40 family peptidase [Treponema sp.]|nr:C40 family peptidase [Treponema sp.]